MAQVDGSTQKQAASFEEVTAASALLSNEAEALKKSTSRFKTGEEVTSFKKKSSTLATTSAIKKAAVPASATGNLAEKVYGWDEF